MDLSGPSIDVKLKEKKEKKIMGVACESKSKKLYSMSRLCIKIALQNSPTIRR